MAALLTRMSSEPNRSTVAATHGLGLPGVPGVGHLPVDLAGAGRPLAAVDLGLGRRSSASALREEIITEAPAEAKGGRDGLADPPGGAGDQRGLPVQSEFHGRTP